MFHRIPSSPQRLGAPGFLERLELARRVKLRAQRLEVLGRRRRGELRLPEPQRPARLLEVCGEPGVLLRQLGDPDVRGVSLSSRVENVLPQIGFDKTENEPSKSRLAIAYFSSALLDLC